MSPYAIIIASMLALNVVWAWISERLSRGRWWRWIARVFFGAQTVMFLLSLSERMVGGRFIRLMPRAFYAGELIWYFLGLGLSLGVGAAVALALVFRRGYSAWLRRRLRLARANFHGDPAPQEGLNATRREFLGLAVAALPPLFTFSLSSVALSQLDRFRVRRFTLAVPGLPDALDGATIAHVADMHVGVFTSERLLRAMVATVNNLRADLVLLTGDLINHELSDLSGALDLARAMPGRYGQCLIEGNHDLFENAGEFESRARRSGIPFLLNESMVLTVRGHPVQLLGIRWSNASPSETRDEAIGRSVSELLPQRQEGAFPILLAHHPHAFDFAAAAGLPLTLAGHTHGGQLMLNGREGAGPILFRYWSGRYVRGSSQLIVSNGVGNWFPLRMNAPAEIVHLTLRAG